MLNFIRKIPSYLKGSGFEDGYDVDEFLEGERTTKLQVVLIISIFLILGITIRFVIPAI